MCFSQLDVFVVGSLSILVSVPRSADGLLVLQNVQAPVLLLRAV